MLLETPKPGSRHSRASNVQRPNPLILLALGAVLATAAAAAEVQHRSGTEQSPVKISQGRAHPNRPVLSRPEPDTQTGLADPSPGSDYESEEDCE